jgi:GNAT superfamily N-acetyltransferase
MSARIRRACYGDELKIADCLIQLARQHVRYDSRRFSNFLTPEGAAEFYRSRFDSSDAAVLVAEIENEIVGFAYLEFQKRNYEELVEDVVWLHDIYVCPAARSTGVGNALMQASIAAAKDMGGYKLLLSVAAQNEIARAFFNGFGFRTTMLEKTLNLDD